MEKGVMEVIFIILLGGENMSKKTALAKNTIIIFMGRVCTQLISFFLLPLYTSYLIMIYTKIWRNNAMEYLDILDENGNKTGEKDTRENIHKLGLLHSEVAAFIYTDTGEILLQKRKSNKATYAGVWSVTGGHVLTGENNEDAIMREIKEELNINVNKDEINFVTKYRSKKVKDNIINNKFFSIYNIKISMEQLLKIKIQKEELEDVKLFSIDEIENILNRDDKHYKFPQKSELAIMIIKEKMTKNQIF